MKPILALTTLAAVIAAAPCLHASEKWKKKDEIPQSGSAGYRPAAPAQGTKDKWKDRDDKYQKPSVRPQPLPQPVPEQRPDRRPVPETKPATRPGTGNGIPSWNKPATKPAYPDYNRPTTKPAIPERPTTRPVPLPDHERPTTKPSPERPWEKPQPERPWTRPYPDRPTTKPQPLPDDDDFAGFRPWPKPKPQPDRPEWPSTRPTRPHDRPVLPGIDLVKPSLPIHRPPRPTRPTQNINIWQNHTNVWNQWTVQNNITINNFVVNRPAYWGKVERYWSSGDSWRRWQQPDWWEWRRDLWDYRRHRCTELWNSYYWLADQLFDLHWWRYCDWASGYGRLDDVPSWWWWTPVSWGQLTAHVKKLPREQEPLVFDPGVTVIIAGDRVYRDGRDAGSARQFVEFARHEANPDFRWEPPFPGGRHDWLPLGVWALTRQEQGEASMFLQLSISRDGLISGGFTNIQTGEDLPIKGGTNRDQQRVAFHIGNNTDTVIECGLAHLTQDVAGAFLHFPDGRSQTWLLARLPGPGSAPGPVRIPWLDRR